MPVSGSVNTFLRVRVQRYIAQVAINMHSFVSKHEASSESRDIIGCLWICLPSRSYYALLRHYRRRIGDRIQGCVERSPPLKAQ
jgi:hypothetical protein